MKKRNIYRYCGTVLLLLLISLLVFYFYNPQKIRVTGMVTSQVGNLSAGVATSISCTWSNEALAVSFGTSLNPGVNDVNATNNYAGAQSGTLYNVTVDTLSNVNVDITIKGSNLLSGVNTIGVGNVTWQSNTTDVNGTNMIPTGSIAVTTSFDTTNKVAANEQIGSTVWYRFWFDIPSGQIAGTYTGNYTQQCQQA